MSWSIGYDNNLKRDVGYGVPAYCDHPGCNAKIDRGLAYVCGGDIYGGEHGCGLHFCGSHLWYGKKPAQVCARCKADKPPFDPKPDHPEWLEWKLTDDSWADWRAENAAEVEQMRARLPATPTQEP